MRNEIEKKNQRNMMRERETRGNQWQDENRKFKRLKTNYIFNHIWPWLNLRNLISFHFTKFQKLILKFWGILSKTLFLSLIQYPQEREK